MTQAAIKPPNHWAARMFQMRFGFLMTAIAGCAVVCWSIVYYQANIDTERSMFNQQIATLRTSSNATERRVAAQALDGIRPSQLGVGAPALIAGTKDPDAEVRAAAASSLATSLVYYFNITNGEIPPQRDAGSLAIIALLGDSNANVRANAARGLNIMSQNNIVQGGKTKSLSLDLKVVSAPLTKRLNDPDPLIVLEVFRTLKNLGTDPATMLPALRKIARTAGPSERAQAVAAIAETLRARRDSPAELIGYIDDDSPIPVRLTAAAGLAKPWKDANIVALALTRRLNSCDPVERAALVSSLSTIPQLPAEVVPILIRLLDDTNIRDEYQLQTIADAAPLAIQNAPAAAAMEAVPALSRAAWRHKSASSTAATVLVKLAGGSSEAKALIPRLLKEFRETRNYQDKVSLARTLGLFGSEASEAAPTLLQAVTMAAPNNELRAAACLALSQIGPDAKFAIPTLAKIVMDLSKLQVFPDDVIDAILTLDPNSPEAADWLVRIVQISETPDRGDFKAARAYLDKLAKHHDVTSNPTLLKLTESTDPEMKARARALLKRYEIR